MVGQIKQYSPKSDWMTIYHIMAEKNKTTQKIIQVKFVQIWLATYSTNEPSNVVNVIFVSQPATC